MKTAIVTGASSDIGSSIVKELSRNGYYVALIGRNEEKLAKLLKEIDDEGEIFLCDLSKLEEINVLVKNLTNLQNITALVYAAGIWHDKGKVFANIPFDGFPQQIVLDTYAVGLLAPTLISHALIPLMSTGSSIINISGTFENGAKGWVPYFVSKKGIEDLTLGLSQDLEDRDIKVNCISPSDTNTEAYRKFFPKYVEDTISVENISEKVIKILNSEETGKFYVIKKGKEVYEGYHA